jgi:hypothetical protein
MRACYLNVTFQLFSNDEQQREVILKLLRQYFARNYAPCLNKLVSEAQVTRNLLINRFTFCLDERTTGITVVIPSASSWLSVIRDSVNFILQQLNGCLNALTTVAGRKAASDCIQLVKFHISNLISISKMILLICK